jgi:DNA-binding response OmpR family regulator
MAEILIIEDEKNIARAVRDKLSREGYQVVFFQSGRAALEYLADHTPDLIILDLLMPEMDGFQVVRELKEHPQWQAIPILILSILSEEARVRELGADAYLTKPYKGADLLAAVRDILEPREERNNG